MPSKGETPMADSKGEGTCKECGAKIGAKDAFCKYCGAPYITDRNKHPVLLSNPGKCLCGRPLFTYCSVCDGSVRRTDW